MMVDEKRIVKLLVDTLLEYGVTINSIEVKGKVPTVYVTVSELIDDDLKKTLDLVYHSLKIGLCCDKIKLKYNLNLGSNSDS